MPKGDKQRGPQRRPVSYTAAFTQKFIADRALWEQTNPSVAKRLKRLIDETVQAPFTGIGKPEPLKEDWQGFWSRRITDEHRMIYCVEGRFVIFLYARNHY